MGKRDVSLFRIFKDTPVAASAEGRGDLRGGGEAAEPLRPRDDQGHEEHEGGGLIAGQSHDAGGGHDVDVQVGFHRFNKYFALYCLFLDS